MLTYKDVLLGMHFANFCDRTMDENLSDESSEKIRQGLYELVEKTVGYTPSEPEVLEAFLSVYMHPYGVKTPEQQIVTQILKNPAEESYMMYDTREIFESQCGVGVVDYDWAWAFWRDAYLHRNYHATVGALIKTISGVFAGRAERISELDDLRCIGFPGMPGIHPLVSHLIDFHEQIEKELTFSPAISYIEGMVIKSTEGMIFEKASPLNPSCITLGGRIYLTERPGKGIASNHLRSI